MKNIIKKDPELFSEIKERENRFKTALKISVPFIVSLIVFAYLLFKNKKFDGNDVILSVILILCFVYYAIYQIYFSFNKSLIDPITKVFIRDEIFKILNKEIKKEKPINIILLRIKNIIDINDRYGYKNGDEILYLFCREFNSFMAENGVKNLPIGRLINGNFLCAVDTKTAHLIHLLNMFEHKIANQTIKNIEIKLDYATILSDYDKNLSNIINALFYKINHKNDDQINIENIELDSFEISILKAIDNENFSLKSQLIKSVSNSDEDYQNLIPKLDLQSEGKITKSRIIEFLLLHNYDIKYDIALIRYIGKNLYFKDIKSKIFVEILPQSLRNSDFKNEILKLIDNNLIDPKKIVFEFNEALIYPEIKRFKEIIDNYKEIGFSFALSQFGGPNASFQYLKNLDVDFIIYDMEFNKNLNSEKYKNLFVKLNEACKKSGIKTVIRFVDKQSFYDEVKTYGIDLIQGFCIEKPVDIN